MRTYESGLQRLPAAVSEGEIPHIRPRTAFDVPPRPPFADLDKDTAGGVVATEKKPRCSNRVRSA